VKTLKELFRLKTETYNSLCALAGSIAYADTWTQALGLILLSEAVLVTIERCWPRGERPE
jgi:hypothetical protein